MLNWFGSQQINDETFGKLEYKKYVFHKNFWKGKIHFPSISKEVDIYIISDKKNVSETQKDFYIELVEKYKETPEFFYNNLPDAFEYCHGKEFTDEIIKLENIEEEFILDRIYIPNIDESDEFWELSYNYKRWNESYTLFFFEWKYMYGEYDD